MKKWLKQLFCWHNNIFYEEDGKYIFKCSKCDNIKWISVPL